MPRRQRASFSIQAESEFADNLLFDWSVLNAVSARGDCLFGRRRRRERHPGA